MREPAGDPLELTELDESAHVAFYGALFAMALADGVQDPAELAAIEASLDHAGFEDSGRDRVLAYARRPPTLDSCLEALSGLDLHYRLLLFNQLLQVMLADGKVLESERQALDRAQGVLEVTSAQRQAMESAAEVLMEAARDGDHGGEGRGAGRSTDPVSGGSGGVFGRTARAFQELCWNFARKRSGS